MSWVQSGFKPFNAIEYGVGIRIKNHDALKNLSRGEAKQIDITTLVDAMNMTEGFVRLRQDLGADWARRYTCSTRCPVRRSAARC